MTVEFLDKCVVCGRIQVSKKPDFWLDEEDNPKAYLSIIKDDYRGRTAKGLCPEDIEKYKKIYGR